MGKLKKIAEGKTKEIYDISGTNMVLIKNRNAITADNDPTKTKEFSTKATHATTTTCAVFAALEMSDIPTSFGGRVDATSFTALRCDMIALEVIGRRYATGSYLKRHPEFKRDGPELHRFDEVLFEVFLKTTDGKLIIDGETLVDGLTSETDDPLIINPFEENWQLYHPKKENLSLDKTILSEKILGEFTMEHVRELLEDTFETIELLFEKFNLKLIDIKIELGVNSEGNLVVSDVIDNDSWRLMDENWVEMSKQRFRDGDDLANVEAYYEKVASIVSQFPLFAPEFLGQGGDPTEWDWSEFIEGKLLSCFFGSSFFLGALIFFKFLILDFYSKDHICLLMSQGGGMVDTLASGASAARCVGSSPILGKFVIVGDAHFFIITKPCILPCNPYTTANLFYVMTFLDVSSAEYEVLIKTLDEPSRRL